MRYTQRHIDRFISIIRKDGIDVDTVDGDVFKSEADCYSLCQNIRIGVDDYKWLCLATIAHEVGHCLSVRLSRAGGKKCLPMRIALRDNFGLPLSDKQKKAVIDEERRAWFLGFKKLREIGIPVDDKLKRARKVLVESHIRRLRNRA